jgi:hypothetical protein
MVVSITRIHQVFCFLNKVSAKKNTNAGKTFEIWGAPNCKVQNATYRSGADPEEERWNKGAG